MADDEPGIPGRVMRTVSPAPRNRPDTEMGAVGVAIGLGVLILLVPLLPFLIIVWVISKLIGGVSDRATSD